MTAERPEPEPAPESRPRRRPRRAVRAGTETPGYEDSDWTGERPAPATSDEAILREKPPHWG